MKKEAEFTRKVKSWLLENIGTAAYEIKHTRGLYYFNMRELKEHQRDFLLAARSRHGMCFKIPDDGIAYKPFDLFCLKQASALVVIAFPEYFYVVDIEKLLKWSDSTITEEEIEVLAMFKRKVRDL